jgi:hypothetical protein
VKKKNVFVKEIIDPPVAMREILKLWISLQQLEQSHTSVGSDESGASGSRYPLDQGSDSACTYIDEIMLFKAEMHRPFKMSGLGLMLYHLGIDDQAGAWRDPILHLKFNAI